MRRFILSPLAHTTAQSNAKKDKPGKYLLPLLRARPVKRYQQKLENNAAPYKKPESGKKTNKVNAQPALTVAIPQKIRTEVLSLTPQSERDSNADSDFRTPLSPSSEKLTNAERDELIHLELSLRIASIGTEEQLTDSAIERLIAACKDTLLHLDKLRQNLIANLITYQHTVTHLNQLVEVAAKKWLARCQSLGENFYNSIRLIEREREYLRSILNVIPDSDSKSQLSYQKKFLDIYLALHPDLRLDESIIPDSHSIDYYALSKLHTRIMHDLAGICGTNLHPPKAMILAAADVNQRYVLPLFQAADRFMHKTTVAGEWCHPSWSIPWWKFWRQEHWDWYRIAWARRRLENVMMKHLNNWLSGSSPYLKDDHNILIHLIKRNRLGSSFCHKLYANKNAFYNICENVLTDNGRFAKSKIGGIDKDTLFNNCWLLSNYLLKNAQNNLTKDGVLLQAVAAYAHNQQPDNSIAAVLYWGLKSRQRSDSILSNIIDKNTLELLPAKTLVKLALKVPSVESYI